jgi:hypothetical protein
VLDRLRMVWTGRFEKFQEVIVRLSRFTLEITLGGHDMLLIGAAILLVVIIVTAGSTDYPLGMPLLLPWVLFLVPLLATLDFRLMLGFCHN